MKKEYDIAIIGAGHAGCEAALACARLGFNTIIFSINLDAIANLPCNPSIGGTAKGHLVREIDALGGQMGLTSDKVFIQSRMLNKSRGPAVHSLRVQADRRAYQTEMKHVLESQENLTIRQAEIVDIKNDGKEWFLTSKTGLSYSLKAVIVAAGTYLKGKIIIGEASYDGGPDGMFAANELSNAFEKLGLPLMRFKTGTPPRINRNSIDFSNLQRQDGDNPITPFSFTHENYFPLFGEERHSEDFPNTNRVSCHICYTNEKTHEIIKNNLHRSPLYSGMIKGVGPRYCPSIEDKIVRFADKSRHQLFLEPVGLLTDEMYLQGFSSSLPEDVQEEMLHSIEGLENAVIMRSAYAIEYDCFDPTALTHSLMFKDFPGLFSAGQTSGSSGYEEAAAQGLIAGINAALYLEDKDPFTLTRQEGYAGVLIDDLVTKGTKEPYRMLTARAEFRLLLRQDNADARLTPYGHKLGLIDEKRYNDFLAKQDRIEKEIARIRKTNFSPDTINPVLEKLESTPASSGVSAENILKRPQVSISDILTLGDNSVFVQTNAEAQSVEIAIKYEGYLKRQEDELSQHKKLENFKIPKDFDYSKIIGIRIEARQKLEAQRPGTIGQASRISGVNPADITCLMIGLKK